MKNDGEREQELKKRHFKHYILIPGLVGGCTLYFNTCRRRQGRKGGREGRERRAVRELVDWGGGKE